MLAKYNLGKLHLVWSGLLCRLWYSHMRNSLNCSWVWSLMECELALQKPQGLRAVVISKALYLQMLPSMFTQAINWPLNPEAIAPALILDNRNVQSRRYWAPSDYVNLTG